MCWDAFLYLTANFGIISVGACLDDDVSNLTASSVPGHTSPDSEHADDDLDLSPGAIRRWLIKPYGWIIKGYSQSNYIYLRISHWDK